MLYGMFVNKLLLEEVLAIAVIVVLLYLAGVLHGYLLQ